MSSLYYIQMWQERQLGDYQCLHDDSRDINYF